MSRSQTVGLKVIFSVSVGVSSCPPYLLNLGLFHFDLALLLLYLSFLSPNLGLFMSDVGKLLLDLDLRRGLGLGQDYVRVRPIVRVRV